MHTNINMDGMNCALYKLLLEYICKLIVQDAWKLFGLILHIEHVEVPDPTNSQKRERRRSMGGLSIKDSALENLVVSSSSSSPLCLDSQNPSSFTREREGYWSVSPQWRRQGGLLSARWVT